MNEINAVKLRIKSDLLPVNAKLQTELREAFWHYCDLVGFPVAANYVLDMILDLRKDFDSHEEN